MADSGNIWAATLNSAQLAIAVAPLGTALPTSASATLNGAFTDLGWVGEDGVINAITRETTKHYAFGGEVVKTTQDRYSETIRFTLLESNADVLATVFGSDSVTESSGNITVEHESKMNERVSMVFDFIDGDNAGRIVVREGLVIEVGEISYVHTAPTAYELTVDVYRTAAGLAGAVKYLDYAGS
jgi:hypothetical protein